MTILRMNDKEYFAVPEVKPTTCKGCVFAPVNHSCGASEFGRQTIGLDCNNGYIFVPNTPANRKKWAPIIARARMKVGE